MVRITGVAVTCAVLLAGAAAAAPTVQQQGDRTLVTGDRYRVTFMHEAFGFAFELQGTDGQWHLVAASPGLVSFAYFQGTEYGATGLRATRAIEQAQDVVVVGQQVALDAETGLTLDLHCLCAESGLLLGAQLAQRPGGDGRGVLWSPPRIGLRPTDWDGYLFWAADEAVRAPSSGSTTARDWWRCTPWAMTR